MEQSLVKTETVFSQTVGEIKLKMEESVSRHYKILVIDDNEQTTTMLSKFFDAKGFQTTITNDPMEGLGLIRKEKFDVILLDVMMPVISGIGIIELLAGDNTLKDQNIFIFSGANLPSIQLKNLLRRDGVNGFLKKTIELDDLLKAIIS
jgi:CheY-like chemotaxis protein